MKTVYRYYCLYRPPMPGSVPMKDLDRVEDFGYPMSCGDRKAWGCVDYTRELTEKEISDYELVASKDNPLLAK